MKSVHQLAGAGGLSTVGGALLVTAAGGVAAVRLSAVFFQAVGVGRLGGA